MLAGNVLSESNFVSPAVVGATHTVWSFTGTGTAGWANPDGERLESENWSSVRERLFAEIVPRKNLVDHLAELAAGVIRAKLSANIDLPQTLTIGERTIESRETIQAVVNICHVARAVSLTGGSWWVALTSAAKD